MYYSTVENLGGIELKINIGILNFEDCSVKEIFQDTTVNDFSNYIEWRDIALSNTGQLFGLGFDGIYSIDTLNDTFHLITNGPSTQKRLKGMVCTKDSVLIFGERDIYTFDLKTNLLSLKGRMPNLQDIWSNIFWYKATLMGSINTGVTNINLIDPASSLLECYLPPLTSGLLSLTEVAITCDSTVIFALFVNGEIYELNPSDCTLSFYCSLPGAGILTFQGSEPEYPYIPPNPCMINLDLDQFNSTTSGIDFIDTIFCDLPSQYLTSVINISSDKTWDSLTVWIDSAPNGILLDGTIPPFASLKGKNSNRLCYEPTNLSDLTALSSYLSELTLTGVAPPGFSNLKIGFCAWADYLVSDTAYSYITLVGRSTTSGQDSFKFYCPLDDTFSLTPLLSLAASKQGKWYPHTAQPSTFIPGTDQPGNYLYIVEDPYCNPDTALFNLQPFPSNEFDLGLDRIICPGDTTVIVTNPSYGHYVWSDGSTNSLVILTEPQQMLVTLTDDNGCVMIDSINIRINDDCVFEDLFIPNVFSPNQNGINDEWIIGPSSEISNMEITIFDRWGNALFHQEDNKINWNGQTTSGKEVHSGVYVYQLILQSINGTQKIRMGNVTILQ